MPVCSIRQCGARKNINQPQLTIHRFPKNKAKRRKWLNIIGTESINPQHTELYACCLHFEESSFNKNLKVIRLRDDAAPSLCLYEFKIFLRKRERRELLLQRSRTLFSNLLKERPLAISGTFVLFGFNVQLVASDMPAKQIVAGEKPQYGLALSSLVSARQVDFMQNINDGCLMTLSPITTPCCRNTFVILSTEDESIRGEKMNYGDEFFLRAENYGDPDAAPLYVRYTPEGAPTPADRMPIRLSSTKDTNCRWSTIPLLPRDRLEGQGSPVKTGAKLIVKNCVADKNLCVMNQLWMQTFFGPECGVTCRNYIDIHKRFTAENIFTLVSDVETKSQE